MPAARLEDTHEGGVAAFRAGKGHGERRLLGIAEVHEVGGEIGDAAPAQIALDDEQLPLRRRVAQQVGLAGVMTLQPRGLGHGWTRRMFVVCSNAGALIRPWISDEKSVHTLRHKTRNL